MNGEGGRGEGLAGVWLGFAIVVYIGVIGISLLLKCFRLSSLARLPSAIMVIGKSMVYTSCYGYTIALTGEASGTKGP